MDIGAHVFPTAKFGLVRKKLLKDRLLRDENLVQAEAASQEELLLVHTKTYLDKLDQGNLSTEEIFVLELPYSRELVRASRICVGGTILAAKFAIKDQQASVHLGGGFHHAFADHGEGFCVLNDVACAARSCLEQPNIERVIIIDCDLHQGNGNADIFKNCKNVFTFSIHQQNNYPVIKPPSDLDIGLADGTGDQEYLTALTDNLPQILQDFQPQLIFYIAGADPYLKDQLGALRLTFEGLSKRDEFIFNLAKQIKAPVAVVFGGGYARDLNDTVAIHYNTVKKAQEIFS